MRHNHCLKNGCLKKHNDFPPECSAANFEEVLIRREEFFVTVVKEKVSQNNNTTGHQIMVALESEESPKYWPPLGLPVGSVRAILTLFVVGIVTASVARGHDLDLIWTETLLIALAHYFTSRRFVSLPPDVLRRIQEEGLIEKEQHPLFLPRHSIRLLILAAFVGLGVFLYKQHRIWEPRAVSLLGIVAAYVLGAMFRSFGTWFGSRTGRRPSSALGDFKAIIVLLAVGIAGIPELLDMPELLPAMAHRVALGMMLFYFGSR